MKPYAVRKMMLVIATFACLLGGTWMFHATAPHAEGAKATKPKVQPMVLVYDTTKSAGTTITLPIIGRAGERIGKANFTAGKDVFTSQNHRLKNGQEIWVSGTGDTTNPYRVTNAQKNTFSLMEMSTGIDGTGFEPGIKIDPDAEGRFAFGGDGYSWGWSGRKWDKIGLHKAVLPDVTIQWGDGKTSRVTASGLATHTYAKKGKYTVTITGRLPQLGWGIEDEEHKVACPEEDTQRAFPGIEKLVEVKSFGALDTNSLSGAFAGAASLIAVPDVFPPTVTNVSGLFSGAKIFNDNIVRWDTSNVTNMSAMLCGATAFNQPLEKWNVSKVTNMSGMFAGAKSFNQPLAQWNVSKVTEMIGMFEGATKFNQALEKWNVSKVTNMSGMFEGAKSFNQPLEKWNVSQVKDMSWMFNGTKFFNQDLSRWCVREIKAEPEDFSLDATNWKKAKPQWGTCP